jgi:hypothetical protein
VNTFELDNQLNAFIMQRTSEEALLQFHDESVIAQMNDDADRHGRDECMHGPEALEKNITKFEPMLAPSRERDVSFSEWLNGVEITAWAPSRRSK